MSEEIQHSPEVEFAALGRPLPPHVPAHAGHPSDLHYDITQLLTTAQADAIKTSNKMAFHVVGDSGNDSHHNGGPRKRAAVVHTMETQRKTAPNQPETPCFCMHTGDVIYPHGDIDYYHDEFYGAFASYRNYILAIPGNHDYYGDHLASFKQTFCVPGFTPSLPDPLGRSVMNLPGFHYVVNTPAATIIAMAATSDYISPNQTKWLGREMQQADKGKALIIAVHYPPYCWDGSNNWRVRSAIAAGIAMAGGRNPDLVICGHAHNYQRIQGPYPVLVVGSGGVGTSPVNKYCGGNGSKLLFGTDNAYGAVSLVVDATAKTISGSFTAADVQYGSVPIEPMDTFSFNWAS